MNLINKTTGEVALLWHNEQDPQGLPQNTIRSIYKDDSNIIWLGTYKKGVCYYHESIYKFNMIREGTV